MAKAIGEELGAYRDEALAGFNYAQQIVRRLIKIATDDTMPVPLSIQAAKEIRELSYSLYGKPTQKLDHGFDLGDLLDEIDERADEKP